MLDGRQWNFNAEVNKRLTVRCVRTRVRLQSALFAASDAFLVRRLQASARYLYFEKSHKPKVPYLNEYKMST